MSPLSLNEDGDRLEINQVFGSALLQNIDEDRCFMINIPRINGVESLGPQGCHSQISVRNPEPLPTSGLPWRIGLSGAARASIQVLLPDGTIENCIQECEFSF